MQYEWYLDKNGFVGILTYFCYRDVRATAIARIKTKTKVQSILRS